MERAAGNPLFLRELASVGEKAEDAEDLPDTVEALVATRIDQLAPGDRALLRWASVLGVSFSGSLIAEVLEGDTEVAARLGGLGPTRRVRRARSGRGRRLPLPPRTHPRRGVRGAFVSSAAANSTAESPRSSSSEQGERPRRWQSSSRCTTSTPVAGTRRGRTRASRATSRERSTRTSTPRRFYERAIEASAKVEEPRGRRARTDVACARRGPRSGGQLPRSDRRAEGAARLLKDDPVAQAELYEERALRVGSARLVQHRAAGHDRRAEARRVRRAPPMPSMPRTASWRCGRRSICSKGARGTPSPSRARSWRDAEPLGPSRALARAYSALDGGVPRSRRAGEGGARGEGARDLPGARSGPRRQR